ncbi:MAG: hypothetical protein IMZ54_04790 [Acidobacteria bacterium]|nr:hypothetical protein [Acidobacteriota bacterium]
MATVKVRGVHPNTVAGMAALNLTRLKGWARAILADTAGHDDTAENLAAWVTSAWWEHEDDFRQMATDSTQAGLAAQRAEVLRATHGALRPPARAKFTVDDQVESLMGLGPWLAEKAVKGWMLAHPEAVAAAIDVEDYDELDDWEPLARNITGSVTAQLTAAGASWLIQHAGDTPEGQDNVQVEVTKTWVTEGDDKVRESHAELDGVTIGLDETFDNGVDHPSDRDGEPEEVFNCRCWLTYDLTYGGLGAAQGGTMGTAFEGVLAQTGPETMTGDGRAFEDQAIFWDPTEAPWPFKFDRNEGDHSAAIIGQIDEVWYDGTALRGKGVFHDDSADPETQTLAARAIELLNVAGVSVELDSTESEMRVKKTVWDDWQKDVERAQDEEPPEPEVPGVKNGRVTVDVSAFDDWLEVIMSGRFRGAALVDTAAFNDARISIAASLAIAAAAGESPFRNPMFGKTGDEDPRLVWQKPQRPEEAAGWGCPLTIDEDGTIYGHVALKTRCHGAFAACVLAPDSGGDFSYFLTGEAERGTATGPLILGTTHGVNADGTLKDHNHLANTGSAVADLTVGSDAHGTWCAGKLRPGVTDRQIADLRGSTLSGEWHSINGKLRLVGILAVNSPGYLIQRRTGIAASFTLGASCCGGEDPLTVEMNNLRRSLIEAWANQAAREQVRAWAAAVS